MSALAETTTFERHYFENDPRQVDDRVESLRTQILCSFEKNGMGVDSPEQRDRAQYAAKYLSEVLVRIDPQWQDLATQHILAQAIAETGNLRAVQELPSKYSSSRSPYRGRGLVQITHKSNYAKLAGCAKTIRDNPPPEIVTREQIARSPALFQSELVLNPENAMSESTESGKELNALSLVCYMVDTAERHPDFEEALRCREISCVNNVGCGVNRGPGALPCTPLNSSGRIEAFKKIQDCFSRVAGL